MSKNLNKEINAIKDKNSIENRLLILALYNELYNIIFCNMQSTLSCIGDEESYKQTEKQFKHITKRMEMVFDLVADSGLEHYDGTLKAKMFMEYFLSLVRDDQVFYETGSEITVANFKNELDHYIDVSEYANIIDKYDNLNFTQKAKIMISYRELINDIWLRVVQIYPEYLSRDFRHEILKELNKRLDEYLKNHTNNKSSSKINFEDLKHNMETYLFEYLKNIVKNNYKYLLGFESQRVNYLFSKLDENQSKVWLISMMHFIAEEDYAINTSELLAMPRPEEILELTSIKENEVTIFVLDLVSKLAEGITEYNHITKLDREHWGTSDMIDWSTGREIQ